MSQLFLWFNFLFKGVPVDTLLSSSGGNGREDLDGMTYSALIAYLKEKVEASGTGTGSSHWRQVTSTLSLPTRDRITLGKTSSCGFLNLCFVMGPLIYHCSCYGNMCIYSFALRRVHSGFSVQGSNLVSWLSCGLLQQICSYGSWNASVFSIASSFNPVQWLARCKKYCI